jgi:hypothetical protein
MALAAPPPHLDALEQAPSAAKNAGAVVPRSPDNPQEVVGCCFAERVLIA